MISGLRFTRLPLVVLLTLIGALVTSCSGPGSPTPDAVGTKVAATVAAMASVPAAPSVAAELLATNTRPPQQPPSPEPSRVLDTPTTIPASTPVPTEAATPSPEAPTATISVPEVPTAVERLPESELPPQENLPITDDPLVIRPLSVKKSPIGDGWSILEVELAIGNNSGTAYQWMAVGLADPLEITSAEGFSYRVDSPDVIQTRVLLPPGFHARGTACTAESNENNFQATATVGDKTTGYALHSLAVRASFLGLPKYQLLRKDREVSLDTVTQYRSPLIRDRDQIILQKVRVPLLLGAPDTSLTIMGFERNQNRLSVQYEFENASVGAGADFAVLSYVLGSDGLIRTAATDCGTPQGAEGEFELRAGPGRKSTGERVFFVPASVDNIFLIVAVGENGGDGYFTLSVE